MKPSEELFKLIKSLTKSEKRFFKLTSSLQAGDKNYLRLFDAIENQPKYDEEQIKRLFRGETFIKHLPSEKNHLYKLILKSLRAFTADNSVNSQLQDELKNVELLYLKAHYKECRKIIDKAKNLAYINEKFYYLFELINWEKQLLEEEYLAGNFDKNLDYLIQEEQEVLEKLRNLAEYRILYSKINYVFRKGGFARDEREMELVREITENHLIRGKNTAKSRRAAATCYYIQGLADVFRQDYNSSFEKFSKVVRIFEENPSLIQDIPKQYLRSLNNLLMCYIDNRNFASFFELKDKIQALKNHPAFSSRDIQVKIFTCTFQSEFAAYDAMAEYEKATHIIDKVLEGMERYKAHLGKEEQILFYYNIAYACFGAGRHKDALQWLNRILNDNEPNLRQDIYSFARLFNLAVRFELKQFDYLWYIIKSTSRFYAKQKMLTGRNYLFETLFLKHFSKISKPNEGPGNQKEIFKEMKQNISPMLRNQYGKVILGYFDFLSWIDTKLEDVSFAEVRKRNLTVSQRRNRIN